jgi:hypothetical protein
MSVTHEQLAYLEQLAASPRDERGVARGHLRIGPQEAEWLLATNTKNRPIHPDDLRRYIADMLSGRWLYNMEPLIFALIDGAILRLLMGQHRLYGVRETQMVFDFDYTIRVMTEAEADALFATYDTGNVRSSGDLVSFNALEHGGYEGVGNGNMKSALVAINILDVLIAGGTSAYGLVSPSYRQLVLDKYVDETLWAARLRTNYSGPTRKQMPAGALAAAIASYRIEHDRVYDWWLSCLAGEGLHVGQPAYALHEELVRHSPPVRRTIPVHHWWFRAAKRAWNAYANGRTLKEIRRDLDKVPLTPDVDPIRRTVLP